MHRRSGYGAGSFTYFVAIDPHHESQHRYGRYLNAMGTVDDRVRIDRSRSFPGRSRYLLRWLAMVLPLALPSVVFAEACSQADISLRTQAHVDQFQADYGPCDEVAGDLTIWGFTFIGSDIDSLAPLNQISRVGGTLTLQYLSNLVAVDGLTSLTDVGGDLLVNANYPLTHLGGLANLATIGGEVYLVNLPSLESIEGLATLSVIGGDLTIDSAAGLSSIAALSGVTALPGNLSLGAVGIPDLNGLQNLTLLGGRVDLSNCPAVKTLAGFPASVIELPGGLSVGRNDLLNDLSALSNLTGIGGPLTISANTALHQLTGLDALVSVTESVTILDNPVLVDCTALLLLLDAEDDGLPGPGPGQAGIPDIGAALQLQGNRPVCNNRETIGDLLTASGFE